MDAVNQQIQTLIAILSRDPQDPPVVQEALLLKATHTAYVADNAGTLATAARCSPRNIQLAQRIGWCHDLGRFLQFRRYHTFDDTKSLDHGVLSLKLVRALRLDRDLTPLEKGLLWASVLLHNRRELPGHLPPGTRFWADLIRDADRLDIFRVFIDYYNQGPQPNSPLELSYPDTGVTTSAVIDAILAGASPSYELAQSVQDMRLIKLSWVYTFSTPGAIRLFRDCGILEATRKVLPNTPPVAQALQTITDWSQKHSKAPQ